MESKRRVFERRQLKFPPRRGTESERWTPKTAPSSNPRTKKMVNIFENKECQRPQPSEKLTRMKCRDRSMVRARDHRVISGILSHDRITKAVEMQVQRRVHLYSEKVTGNHQEAEKG